MHVRPKRCPKTDYPFTLNEKLEIVSKYKYLGLTVSEHLDLSISIDELCNAGSRALGGVIGKTKDVHDLCFDTYSRLFQACVTPILDYASGAWGLGGQHPKIDAVQERAARFYMGLPKNAPSLGYTGDTGWTPSAVRRDLNSLRLYNEIIQMDGSRLTRRVMEYDASAGDGEWSRNIQNIMKHLDMENNWSRRTPVNIKCAKNKLIKLYEEVWRECVENKPKLRTYKSIKNNFEGESYLKVNLCKYKRSLMARLRCGILPLELETSRYQGVPPEKRICKMCKNASETELHFLFECNALMNEKEKLFDKMPDLRNHNPIECFKLLTNMPYVFSKVF